jgi:hypothetical protein
MKWIKLVIISAIILFVVVFLLSLLIPDRVRISRAVNITAPQRNIVATVRNPATWTQWNELLKNAAVNGVETTQDQITAGKLDIVYTMVSADTVKTIWRSRQGRQITGVFAFQQSGDVTVVQWYFDFRIPWYPWEKIASINFDKQWGPAMEQSLDNLKEMHQARP